MCHVRWIWCKLLQRGLIHAGVRACRRKKKRRSAGFLDTMADVEASQNAFLSQTSDDGDGSPVASVAEQTGSYDDPATWSSMDWDEFAEQVAPTASAEQLRESKSRWDSQVGL